MPPAPPGHNAEFRMPSSPTRLTQRLNLLALAAPLALAACSAPKQDVFAPPCPQPVILGDAGDLTRYIGPGRDPTELALQARIGGLSGKCEPGGRDITRVTVSVAMTLARGPAAPGREAHLSWLLAVMRGDQVLARQSNPLTVAFPSNTLRVALSPEPVVLDLPTPSGTTAADYKVIVGFELTPDELARNRQGSAGR